MANHLELIVRKEDGKTRLTSPGVGFFTCAQPAGALLGPGQEAGSLITLGVAQTLLVPAGVAGRIISERPERVREPVGFGQNLIELAPLSEVAGDEEQADEEESSAGLALCSPQTGRFYERPGPDDPAFVSVGQEIRDREAVGLIEVMKTFTHVTYTAGTELPNPARVTAILVEDGAEVRAGQPLIEVEAI